LSALTVPDAAERLGELGADIAAEPSRALLLELHEVLIRTAVADDGVPDRLLDGAAAIVAGLDPALIEALPTRPRVVFRLLNAGAPDAARLLLADNATGVVDEPFNSATSSGAPRTSPRLPLLSVIEGDRVFADLPGFRDPRFGAADGCFDISAAIRLKAHVDDAVVSNTLAIAGWAALDIVHTSPEEAVSVVAVNGDRECRWPAQRHRRADLVTGTGEGLRRRAWAGWSADVRSADLGDHHSVWTLWLEVEYDGLRRRTRLGTSVGELAARVAGKVLASGHPKVRLDARKDGWVLAVSGG
jgi:hypothetical protein